VVVTRHLVRDGVVVEGVGDSVVVLAPWMTRARGALVGGVLVTRRNLRRVVG
jgi:hypothetical protein